MKLSIGENFPPSVCAGGGTIYGPLHGTHIRLVRPPLLLRRRGFRVRARYRSTPEIIPPLLVVSFLLCFEGFKIGNLGVMVWYPPYLLGFPAIPVALVAFWLRFGRDQG